MEQLKKDYLKQYYYVNSNVIFNIKKYDDGDRCAVYSEDINGKIPSINVTKQTPAENYKLYLDVLITDGDTYNGTTFKKKIHSDSGTSQITFQDYYKTLCESEMYSNILKYFDKDFNWLMDNLNVVGIPMSMTSRQGYTVTGITQIDLTPSYLAEFKDKIAKEETTKAAKKTAKSLGYKVTSDITVQKE